MKITSLSNKLLKYMAIEYSKTGKDVFQFEEIQNKFPDENPTYLNLALQCMADDDLLVSKYYDNKLAFVILKIKIIVKMDENTLIKKGYKFIKEIKSFI